MESSVKSSRLENPSRIELRHSQHCPTSPSATFPGLGNPSRPGDSTPCQGWAALSGNKAFPDSRRRKERRREGRREGSVSSPGAGMGHRPHTQSQRIHGQPLVQVLRHSHKTQELRRQLYSRRIIPGGSRAAFWTQI